MRQENTFNNENLIQLGNRLPGALIDGMDMGNKLDRLTGAATSLPRQLVIGLILVVALIAFEIFNFDTTQYALTDLLGEVSFMGLRWATILAIAFCFIDFAGLAHLFSPESSAERSKEVWYLMGAWLLGATMNALMTWWAVSLTLLSHEFGNEVMSRSQLLQIVPIFVAVLVWLTRILFIGAFSVAGGHLFGATGTQPTIKDVASRARLTGQTQVGKRSIPAGPLPRTSTSVPAFLQADRHEHDGGMQDTVTVGSTTPERPQYHRTPPRPGVGRPVPAGAMAARPRRSR